MSYFSPAFLTFFKGLADNNTREWFEDNKPTYEKEVKEPFKVFVGDVIDRMRELDSNIQMTAQQAIFRIYRDVRFSKDKTPYKPHASAFIARGGRKSINPGFYFQLTYHQFFLGGGKWDADKDSLRKIRTEIVYSQEEFKKLLKQKAFKTAYGSLSGDKNKILPKEFREEAAKQPFLFNKQFLFNRKMDPETILRDDLLDLVIEHYRSGKPMLDFLQRALEDE